MAPTPNDLAFDQVLVRGGQTGALLRALTAQSSHLGAPSQWPEALRSSMRTCLGSAFPLLIFWGPEYVLLYNDAAIPMMGPHHPSVLGKARAQVVPETWAPVKALLDQVAQSGEPLHFENRLFLIDRAGRGEEAYFTFAFSAIRDEDDVIRGVLNTSIETTPSVLNDRRLRTLQTLSNSTQETRALEEVFAGVKSALAQNPSDLPFARLYAFSSDRTVATLRVSTGELDNEALSPATIRLDDSAAVFPLAQLARSSTLQRVQGLSRWGSAVPDSAYLVPLIHRGDLQASAALVIGFGPPLLADAKHLEFLESIAKSIAIAVSNVRSLEQLAAANREIEVQRARLAAVIDQMPVGVAIADVPSGKIVMANTQIERLFGRPVKPAEDVAAYKRTNVFRLDGTPFPERELPIARAVLDGAVTKREIMIVDFGEGRRATLEVSAAPVLGADGKPTAAVTIFDDVSERIAQEQERARLLQSEAAARAQAEDSDRRKDEFLAMLSHELRNPLAALSAALALAERIDRDPKLEKIQATSRRQVGNLIRLVDDLLDVSRITHGRIELRKSEVSLEAVIQAAIDSTRALVAEKRHQLTTDFGAGPFAVLADPTRLEQVIANLLINAAKYTDPGGRIDVTLTREGSSAVIKVKDSGVGIATAMLPQVFELFVQAETPLHRNSGGLGLGLTLVKRLVELHEGTVEAASAGEGTGSQFTLRLPLMAAAPGAQAASPSQGKTAARRVVIVEDNEDLRLGLQELLQDFGHYVETASDGISGVQKLLQVRPDVAFVDVGLPGLNGYEVARQVRAAVGGKNLYLIALTGYGSAEAKERAANAGFDRHMVKPLRADDLIVLLQSTPTTAA